MRAEGPASAPTPADLVVAPGAAPAGARAAGRWPVISSLIIAAFVLVALLAPVLTPADPYAQSLRTRLKPPVWEEGGTWSRPLGTDRLGRDVLSRVILGARISLAVGVLTVFLAGAIGATVGLTAGYYGGRVDAILMRVTDATLSFPVILLALILATTVGPSFGNVVVAVAVILWARYARVIRGEVLSLMERDFLAHHHSPPLSQHPQHARRAPHAPGRLRHHRGGLALLPGRWHPAAHPGLGLDDRRGS
jgi:peptide/nickel transport system permease protein